MPDHSRAKTELPPIPAKRYFTIGEVSDLCAVKPHVLRYWEQEFTQLKPVKRRGNRRYYQHHEVLLIRRIRDLLYEQGFTINGARHRLESDIAAPTPAAAQSEWPLAPESDTRSLELDGHARAGWSNRNAPNPVDIRQELEEIRQLLGHDS
jgi:DNA-binding transcriptional MerR regulator